VTLSISQAAIYHSPIRLFLLQEGIASLTMELLDATIQKRGGLVYWTLVLYGRKVTSAGWRVAENQWQVEKRGDKLLVAGEE
jgi:hypothetical protein